MSVSERDRHELYLAVEAVHGESVANTFMELLPVTPSRDFVTRTDLLASATMLRGEMAEVRGEMAEVRGEVAELRGHMELRFGRVERMIAMLTAANVVGAVSVLVA